MWEHLSSPWSFDDHMNVKCRETQPMHHLHWDWDIDVGPHKQIGPPQDVTRRLHGRAVCCLNDALNRTMKLRSVGQVHTVFFPSGSLSYHFNLEQSVFNLYIWELVDCPACYSFDVDMTLRSTWKVLELAAGCLKFDGYTIFTSTELAIGCVRYRTLYQASGPIPWLVGSRYYVIWTLTPDGRFKLSTSSVLGTQWHICSMSSPGWSPQSRGAGSPNYSARSQQITAVEYIYLCFGVLNGASLGAQVIYLNAYLNA